MTWIERRVRSRIGDMLRRWRGLVRRAASSLISSATPRFVSAATWRLYYTLVLREALP